DGIHTTIRKDGMNQDLPLFTNFTMPRMRCSAAVKSAITQSRKGMTVFILSWVFPSICIAYRPIAITWLVVRSKATMDGSSTTTLSLWMIRVLAVPKSIATSCVNQLNNPMEYVLSCFQNLNANLSKKNGFTHVKCKVVKLLFC